MKLTLLRGAAVLLAAGVGLARADEMPAETGETPPAAGAPGTAEPGAAAPVPPPAPPAPAATLATATSYDWGGFVKLDVIYNFFYEGDALLAGGRDFFVPNAVPVGERSAEGSIDFHAKESRIFFRTDTALADHRIGTYLEMDFLANQGAADERAVNAYNPSLRHAYLTVNEWLFGQTWTTFQDVEAMPESLDLIGPTSGTVYVRQPMIRYTWNDLQVAVENPETTISCDSFICGTPRQNITTNDNHFPDVVARYVWRQPWGHLSFAGILRELAVDEGTGLTAGITDNTFGAGVSVAGKLQLGRDDLRAMFSAGPGIGRYIGLNTVNDAELIEGNSLEPLMVVAAVYGAYRHFWTSKWRSNVVASYFLADNDDFIFPTTTNSVLTASGNLLYAPVERLTYGLEMFFANRETEDGLDGNFIKGQFSAKYEF